MKYIELTHPLSSNVPSWNGSCGFELENKRDYEEDFCVQKMHMHAGIGTHMDAPLHRFCKARSIADIELQELIVPLCVVSTQADANGVFSLQELREYEKLYRPIWKGALVLIHTGWSRFWSDPEVYRNQMQFPSVSAEVAQYLVDQGIVGLGIDTLSPDCPGSDFPVHRIVLGAGKYLIENVAHADQMPAVGGYVIALPLYAEGAAEAPIRLVGILNESAKGGVRATV